ncbi:MAG: two-component sensor histidine kinase [Gammaproteobacteria bacterium]|nr:two-component sensor histidine kinase [Gammaproteobacteria bacterium]
MYLSLSLRSDNNYFTGDDQVVVEDQKLELGWQFMRYYSLVRLAVAFYFLISPYIFELALPFQNAQLYNSVAISYLIVSTLLVFISLSEQRFKLMSIIMPMVDIGFLAMMAYAGPDETAGFAVIMAIVSVFAILLLRHRAALLYGFGAAMALFIVHWLKHDGLSGASYMDLSLQAFAILMVALLGNFLARRLTNYESEALENSYLISDMHQLNSSIINNMKRGIIVISSNNTILYINKIAWYYLGNPTSPVGQSLKHLAPSLSEQIISMQGNEHEGAIFKADKSSPRLLPKFVKMNNDDKILIALEDYSKISKRIQQAKLASLGQLTASIAHEIRNPLSAINQASQMFDELKTSSQQEKELLQIIQRQSKRINSIIENVQMVSRRKTPERQEILLNRFLQSFIHEFKQGLKHHADIFVSDIDESLKVKFDQSQLKQILSNLFENGLKYSFINTKQYTINLSVGTQQQSRQVYLDIIDQGVGIPLDKVEKIFEPFYTTNHDGTGLGLYISKELCEANGAQLESIPVAFGGACFRIIFDHDYYGHTD